MKIAKIAYDKTHCYAIVEENGYQIIEGIGKLQNHVTTEK